MKPLSICLVLFGLLALVQPAHQLDLPGALLGVVVLLCAASTFRSSEISSFLKIFVGIFSTETSTRKRLCLMTSALLSMNLQP